MEIDRQNSLPNQQTRAAGRCSPAVHEHVSTGVVIACATSREQYSKRLNCGSAIRAFSYNRKMIRSGIFCTGIDILGSSVCRASEDCFAISKQIYWHRVDFPPPGSPRTSARENVSRNSEIVTFCKARSDAAASFLFSSGIKVLRG